MKTIIHAGAYSEVNSSSNVPGKDLQKAIMAKLLEEGLVDTVNSRDYFPVPPTVVAADETAPTELEMKAVPLWGMFKTLTSDNGTYYLYIKTSDTTYDLISTNA